MYNRIRIKPFLFIIVIVFIAGCGFKSEEEVIKDTKDAVEETFKAEGEIEVNKELENFSLYLPDDLTVKEASASNVILKNDDQTYIVFHNKLEQSTSKLNYKSAQRGDEALLIESFSDQDKFGYIRVLASEDDKYELQIGIGGVKITTYTEKSNMVEDAIDMMKIARSIVENDN